MHLGRTANADDDDLDRRVPLWPNDPDIDARSIRWRHCIEHRLIDPSGGIQYAHGISDLARHIAGHLIPDTRPVHEHPEDDRFEHTDIPPAHLVAELIDGLEYGWVD